MRILLLLLITSLEACNFTQPVHESQIIGNWEISDSFSDTAIRNFSKESIPEGVEMALRKSGIVSYRKNGSYHEAEKVTVRIKLPEADIQVKYQVKESGTWKLDNNVLFLMTQGGKVTLADDATKSFARDYFPDFAKYVQPSIGETRTLPIGSISETTMEIELDEFDSPLIYKKKR